MGVARDATEAQIKQAYRKLARKYHPDVSKEKDAEARFKEVGEAYEGLDGPEKRAAYGQLGKGPRPGEDFRPPPDWGAGFEFSGAGARDSDYSDFFEALFGARARAGADNRRGGFHPGRGEDHHATVLLDLDATLRGGTRQLTLRVPEIDADGRLVSTERTLNVQVPKGILAGQHIRLAGQGARPPGEGTPGDLFVEVEFQPLSGAIFEEFALLTVKDLSRMCAVDERHIVEFVEEGVLNVVEINTTEWHFTGAALRRARLALRLERDLELNLAGVALALELMEELERLRRELKARR